MLALIKWLFIWAIVTALVVVVYKVTHSLVTKPNLRYYAIKTIKDIKHMYYRYHV